MRKATQERATISLRYPMHWYTPVHPDAAAAEADARAFLRHHGVIDGPAADARFRAIDVGRHGGWPLYHAGREALLTITRFLAIWLFHDDRIEGTGDAAAELAARAVAGDALDPGAAGPCARAWHDNARRYRARMGAEFCAALAGSFRAWQTSVAEEAAQIVALRATGEHPSVAAYLACRRRSIGVDPVLLLLEYACGRALAPAVRSHPGFAAVYDRAAEVVIMQNDLVSAAKEEGDAQVNLVLSIRHERRCRTDEAGAEIERRHDAAVAGLQRALAALGAAFPTDLTLRLWLRAVRTMCHGFARWHVGAPRYVDARPPGAARCVVEYG